MVGLFQLWGMAGALEAYGARVRKRPDKMVRSSRAVELAVSAVDHQCRLLDTGEVGPEILLDER